MNMRNNIGRYMLPLITSAAYIFLYVPIVVLVVFSFNDSLFANEWHGFTLDWYCKLLDNPGLLLALKNSLIVSVSSVFLSLTLSLLCVYYTPRAVLKKILYMFYANIIVPEIVLAVGLISFFIICKVPLGLPTLIATHTVIGLGYAVPIIHTQFNELGNKFFEAARDLGATHTQVLFTVMLPLLIPALFAAGLLVFIVSLDDFIISFFCAGARTQTLPLYIFAVIRSGATPEINALSTLLLCVSSLLVLLFSLLQVKKMDVLS